MPSPTDRPGTTAPPAPEFDPLAFWILHKGKIVALLVLLTVALLSYGIFEFSKTRAEVAAARALATAKTPDDLRKMIAEHRDSVAAANAELMLADAARKDNKLDESSRLLREFIAKHPEHPLISGAWMSLAVNLETQGNTEEALATYQKISASYPNSFSAPGALMAQARLLEASGRPDDARRAYQAVLSQFGDTLYARDAFF
nr:tetratricopeptide repeat protein [Verrucomicrobiota bacterium]